MQSALNRNQTITYVLMIAAPYVAVIMGLYIFQNAWLSIFLYHGQIVIWWFINRSSKLFPTEPNQSQLPQQVEKLLDIAVKGMLPISALAGIACYFLMPYIVRDVGGLELWLNTNQLSGLGLLLLIPYFGIIHPPIEQVHWKILTTLPPPFNYLSHVLFATYHGLVLYPILQPIWIIACLLILSSISFLWSYTQQKKNGHYLTILSHILADVGIITAVYLLIRN